MLHSRSMLFSFREVSGISSLLFPCISCYHTPQCFLITCDASALGTVMGIDMHISQEKRLQANNNDVPRGTEVNKCTVQWFPNYYQVLPDDGPCGRNM
jgi:hypothetical protein